MVDGYGACGAGGCGGGGGSAAVGGGRVLVCTASLFPLNFTGYLRGFSCGLSDMTAGSQADRGTRNMTSKRNHVSVRP